LSHATLDPTKSEDAPIYWNFSFEEMGLYDLPAEIDFILSKTGQSKVSLVGHSEGTTQTFIGLSMKYDYFKEKVNVFIALAPVVHLYNTPATIMRLIASEEGLLYDVGVKVLGMYDFFPPNWA
jgi:pimeloyl-ACP methyl ester carboxylesterase